MLGSKTWRVAVATAALAAVLTACETGKVVPVAGGDATFTHVGAVVAIPGGGQYVVDTGACVIRKVDLGGGVTTVAGTGTCGYSGDGGPATAAQINPFESTFQAASGHLALDASGNLYLADSNNGRIRKIDTAGTITTIAGDGTGVGILDFETDTCAGATAFAGGITVTPDNTVYVACPFGIGKVLPDGTLQQVLAANPSALTSDAAGNLYFNSFYEGLVKKLDPATNAVTTISDLNPTLGADRFGHSPIATDLALAPDGTLFVAFGPTTYLRGLGCWGCLDTAPAERSIVVRIAAGVPARVAGTGYPDPNTGLQAGYGRDLSLSPTGIAIDGDGNLLVASARSVYKVKDPSRADSGSGSSCSPAMFHPGADLSGLDLTGFDLHRCDLTGINLTGTDLSGTNLHLARGSGIIGTPSAMPAGFGVANGLLLGPGVDLSNQDFEGVVFDGLDLSGARLAGARLENASFIGTKLVAADLTGAKVLSTDFSGANLAGATLNGLDYLDYCASASVDLTGADLTDATFLGSDLCGPSLTNANLSGADLRDVRLGNNPSVRVKSGGIIGTPLLSGAWRLHGGFLIGPNSDLAGTNLAGTDLSGFDLTGADLTGADLSGTDLTGTVLTSTILANANLSNADVRQAVLFFTDLSGANLSGATATAIRSGSLVGTASALPTGISYPHNSTAFLVGPGVDLSGLDLTRVDLSGMDLTGANLTGTTLNKADIGGTDLTGTTLTALTATNLIGTAIGVPTPWVQRGNFLIGPTANLFRQSIGSADLSGLDLTDVIFRQANLTDLDLSGVDLTGADFSLANLTDVDLSTAQLPDVEFGYVDLVRVNLHGANLTNTNFAHATATQVRADALIGTVAAPPADWTQQGTVLTGRTAMLAGADLSNMDLSGAQLTEADLSATNFAGTNLAGAMLTGANVGGTHFAGATLDGVRSSGLIGTPADLPTGWRFLDASLVGRGAVVPGIRLGFLNLSGMDLTGANFSGANLSYTNLVGANVTNLDLSGANLNRLRADQVIGTPLNMPAGWQQRGGVLAGPIANLDFFDLSGLDLSGLDLSGTRLTDTLLGGTNLTGTTFASATGTPTGGATAVYAATTCPDATVVTAPTTCVGHGFNN